ncbi:hypothetical protein OXX79_005448 [Metschnikowia pulcherrima]
MLCFYLIAAVTLATTLASSLEDIHEFPDMEIAIESLSEKSSVETASKEYVFMVNGELIGISNFTMETVYPEKKRSFASKVSVGASWIEFRVNNSGVSWGEWMPTTCPQINFRLVPAVYPMPSTWYYSATWDSGFSFNLALRKAMEMGFSCADEIRDSTTGKYLVPALGVGQLFRKQMLVWQDHQYRKCKKTNKGIACASWSANVRGNLPIKNAQSFGWRVGRGNVDWNHCRGKMW